MYLLKQQNWGGEHFCNLKLVNLKQLKYGTGHCVEWCRGQWLQINKIEIWRKLQKNIDNVYRTRWSGQRYINKLIINSIVMYVLKQSGIKGRENFCNLKLIHFKNLVYDKGQNMECCRGLHPQVNKIEILKKLQKNEPGI